MPFFTRPNFEDRQVVQYSGTSLTLSGDTNINPTGNFRIYKNAFPGLVATSLDADGTVGWGPISGISWSVSACTSPLYVNNLVSCPLSAGTIQVDAGSFDLNSELKFLISLSAGTNNDDILVIDSNGYVKSVPYVNGGNMWYIPYGYTLTVPDNYQSFVYGDLYVLGTIDLQTNAQLVVLNGNIILSGGSIIGSGTTYLVTLGNGCCFTGGTGSCITDLYVTNIHGCSPITIWDQLQHNGSTASGLLSTALGYQTIALGDYSFVQGTGSTAVGAGTIVLGNDITGITTNTVYVSNLNINDTPVVSTTGVTVLVRNTNTGDVESADYDNRLMFIARKYNNAFYPSPDPLVSIPTIPISSGCTYLGLSPCSDAVTITNFEVSKSAPGSTPTLTGMDSITGIWTVPTNGFYSVNMYAFIRANNDGSNSEIEKGDFGNGYFTFGLIGVGATYTQGLSMQVVPTKLSYASGATASSGSTSIGRTSFINFTDSKIVYLTAGAQYQMKVLNNTQLDYIPESYGGSGPHQGLGFSVTKLDL